MRLVSQEANRTLADNQYTPANFGLLFNKYLVFKNERGIIEPLVKQSKKPLISQYDKSKKLAAEILKKRHVQQASYCRAMEKSGWRQFIIHAKLTSPFVSGLGMSHPTETGLVLDHISGLPYIPAASQKGVLRLAHMINTLCDAKGNWLPESELEQLDFISRNTNGELEWNEDRASQSIFGTCGAKEALAGQLVVLDAYPLSPPDLGEEIMNPHFNDYYQGTRGPTEDQSPVPIKFLAVKQGAEFVFRLLLRQPLEKTLEKDQEALARFIEKSLHRALTEEGFGAKTALGFGRFSIKKHQEPEIVEKWRQDQDEIDKPWLKYVRQINAIAGDWGQLRQLALDDDAPAKKYQNQLNLAEVVKAAALRVKKEKPKKWDSSRDELMESWLVSSGLEWLITEDKKNAEPPAPVANESLLQAIENLSSFKEFQKNKDLKIRNLDLACVEALEKPFRLFKCNKAKKKTPEGKAWIQLKKRLNVLGGKRG